MKPERQTSSNNPGDVFLFKAGTPQQQIDSIVWTAFKSGDRKAFNYFFQKYIKLLYTYGGKITPDQNLVEDCIQDLFVELWRKREIVSEVTSVKFYLLKSLRRRIIRKLALQKGQPLDQEVIENCVDAEPPLEAKIIEEQRTFEQHERLFHALAQLSKRQREAIYLKFYEKVTYDQLAEIMELTVRSAYNLVGKAIDTLRRYLGPVS